MICKPAVYGQMYTRNVMVKTADRYGVLWLKSNKRKGQLKARFKVKDGKCMNQNVPKKKILKFLKTVKTLFDLENPKHKPVFTEFRTQVKRKL